MTSTHPDHSSSVCESRIFSSSGPGNRCDLRERDESVRQQKHARHSPIWLALSAGAPQPRAASGSLGQHLYSALHILLQLLAQWISARRSRGANPATVLLNAIEY